MTDKIKNSRFSTAGFKVLKRDKKSKARLGVLTTPHGVVQTPSYVFVGTYGKFLHLEPFDITRAKVQLIIANTFHLWDPALASKSGAGKASGKTFLTKSFGLNIPTMTDSGGFQVLSLAFGDKNKVGKFTPSEVASPRSEGLATGSRARLLTGFMTGDAVKDDSYKRSKIRITQKGVHFNFKGKKLFLGPELSMQLQRKIGADIIFAFDQITSPLDDFDYNEKAVAMTNKWAHLCLDEHARQQKGKKNKQMLFGIVQGGLFPKLRKSSAQYIGSLPFDGFGIGGSYTKKQISQMLKWVIPYLPDEKPRHLLGVGKVADIFEAIENGIDTFDCVIPTREARHGRLYTNAGHMDIRKGRYATDKKVIEKGCGCLTCSSGIKRMDIKTMIRSKDRALNAQGQRWCLMHNMWFFDTLLENVRTSLARGSYQSFKKRSLKKFGPKA